MIHGQDIEVMADAHELEQGYRAETLTELALDMGASGQRLNDLERYTADLLARMDRHALELEELERQQVALFTEWLS